MIDNSPSYKPDEFLEDDSFTDYPELEEKIQNAKYEKYGKQIGELILKLFLLNNINDLNQMAIIMERDLETTKKILSGDATVIDINVLSNLECHFKIKILKISEEED